MSSGKLPLKSPVTGLSPFRPKYLRLDPLTAHNPDEGRKIAISVRKGPADSSGLYHWYIPGTGASPALP